LAALWRQATETKAAALTAAIEPMTAAESMLRGARTLEKEKREALNRTLRKSAAVLRAELMDEKRSRKTGKFQQPASMLD